MSKRERITVRVPDNLYERLMKFSKENPQYSQKTKMVLYLLEIGLEHGGND